MKQMDDSLEIGNTMFRSRLFVGTGKYPSNKTMVEASTMVLLLGYFPVPTNNLDLNMVLPISSESSICFISSTSNEMH